MDSVHQQPGLVCPRCGVAVEAGARFCPNCGLPTANLPAGAAIPPPVPFVPAPVPAWAGAQGPVTAPTGGAGARSVVQALTPRRPPTWAFWVGLVMCVAALVSAVCPLLLSAALALDPESEDPAGFLGSGLLVSGCVVMALLVPGVALVISGRPRRY